MTTEQRNLILVSIVIIIIGTGAWYFSKKPAETPPVLGGEEATTPSGSPLATPVGLGGGVISNGGSAPVVNLQEKFDTAMANASKAYLNSNYSLALKYYNEALTYKITPDKAYSGMFNVYTAQKDWPKAEQALNMALDFFPVYTEYWKWKLTLLDDKTNATFSELKQIYENGLLRSDSRNKINLVTHFAVMAESNGEKNEAIALWEYAKQLYPAKVAVYQAEIDRLRAM